MLIPHIYSLISYLFIYNEVLTKTKTFIQTDLGIIFKFEKVSKTLFWEQRKLK